MKRLTIYSSILILFSHVVVEAGRLASPVQAGQRWERYTGKDESFSVSLPERPAALPTYRPARFIDAREGQSYLGTLYSAYSEGVVYLIYSFPRRSEPLEQFVDEFAAHHPRVLKVVSEEDVPGGVRGKRYAIKFSGVDGALHFYVTDERAYILEAVGAGPGDASVRRFLESFTFGRATDPAVIEVRPGRDRQTPDAGGPDSGPVFTPKEVERKAVIVFRQEPQYTDDAREARVRGRIVVKAVLSASGKVTDVEVIKSLPRGLTEKAVEAARRTIFIPAMKEGKFVSQTIQFEFNFSVF